LHKQYALAVGLHGNSALEQESVNRNF